MTLSVSEYLYVSCCKRRAYKLLGCDLRQYHELVYVSLFASGVP